MRLPVSLLALAFAAPALATLPPPDDFDRSYYLQEENDGLGPERGTLFDAWEAEMRPLVRTHGEDKAAVQLAARYGLSQVQMRELLALWLYAAWNFSDRVPDAQANEVFTRFDALLVQTKRAPLVVQAKAVALEMLDHCNRPMLDATLAGSTAPAEEAWQIAQVTPDCPAAQALLARHDPARALPSLFETLKSRWLDPGERIAVLEYLLAPPAIERIAPQQRLSAGLRLNRILINELVVSGLYSQAIARFEALPPQDRDALLGGQIGPRQVLIDGRPALLPMIYDLDPEPAAFASATGTISASGEVKVVKSARSDSPAPTPRPQIDGELIIDLATAYLATGQDDAARAIFGRYDLVGFKRWQDCAKKAGGMSRECGNMPDTGPSAMLLDRLFNRPGEDPYPLAEAFMSGSMGLSEGRPRHRTFGPWAVLACKTFVEPRYATLCGEGLPVAPPERNHDWNQVHPPALDLAQALIPGFADRSKAIAASLPGAGLPVAEGYVMFSDRPAREPEALPWPAEPVPAKASGSAKAADWQRGWAPLPRGFEPVRVAIEGDRIGVISLSQRYDPAGEVSPGGYWLHLSGDGGKSWKAPIYTGLVHRFPYVVLSNPRLPMFDGDTLTLAVNEELLDTRSITYPPVGLVTLRKRTGLMLRIPLADLTRDTNGDGTSDIAARHLLLEGGTARAVRLGQPEPAACSGEAVLRASATAAVLGRLAGRDSGALFEPVDREKSKPLSIEVQRMDVSGGPGPLLIAGDPSDFACLATNIEVIVFPPEAIAAMATKSPDFRAVSIERAIVNRAGDRGYVVWSAGWTGGTLGLVRRKDGSWEAFDISSWIT